jgi:hypothetical protein
MEAALCERWAKRPATWVNPDDAPADGERLPVQKPATALRTSSSLEPMRIIRVTGYACIVVVQIALTCDVKFT